MDDGSKIYATMVAEGAELLDALAPADWRDTVRANLDDLDMAERDACVAGLIWGYWDYAPSAVAAHPAFGGQVDYWTEYEILAALREAWTAYLTADPATV